jgi:hypothetical protein
MRIHARQGLLAALGFTLLACGQDWTKSKEDAGTQESTEDAAVITTIVDGEVVTIPVNSSQDAQADLDSATSEDGGTPDAAPTTGPCRGNPCGNGGTCVANGTGARDYTARATRDMKRAAGRALM